MTSLSMLALHTPALWLCFVLPLVLCDNLLCYYSPIQEKEKMSELIVTECTPDKVCFESNGQYGNYSALSAWGCMAIKDCSQHQKFHFKGTTYTMSFNCCDQPYCNTCLNIAAEPLYITLTLVAVGVMGSSF